MKLRWCYYWCCSWSWWNFSGNRILMLLWFLPDKRWNCGSWGFRRLLMIGSTHKTADLWGSSKMNEIKWKKRKIIEPMCLLSRLLWLMESRYSRGRHWNPLFYDKTADNFGLLFYYLLSKLLTFPLV